MFKRFKAWLRCCFSPEGKYDVFKPSERLIYRYYNGGREVLADPLLLYKRVMAVAPELDIDLKVSQSLSKDAPEGHAKAVQKIREAFNLKPLANGLEVPEGEAGTLTDTECIQLLDHFFAFCGWVKKNSRTATTTATATSPTTPPPTGGAGSPATSSTAASGCSASAPSCAGPSPSPRGPESRWEGTPD